MPSMKAIKAKISSVSNINQITKALEVVSTVKLQKIKDQTESYRDFMNEMITTLHRLGGHVDVFGDVDTDSTKTLIVVMSTDKGLCGSLNAKINKFVDNHFAEGKNNTDVYVVGKKAKEFFGRTNYSVIGDLSIKDTFDSSDLVDLYQYVQESLTAGVYGRVVVAFNYFRNALVQEPVLLDLFPLTEDSLSSFVDTMKIDSSARLAQVNVKDIEMEPSAHELASYLQKLMVKYMIYGALLQNKTGEFASRMIAMKNATDNSKDIIKKLRVTFNKARQAAVTQEISEIVSAKMSMEG